MTHNSDTLWRLYNTGGADLALRYAEIASEGATTTRRAPDLEVLSIQFYEGAEAYSGPSRPEFGFRYAKSTTRFMMYWAEFTHCWQYSTFKYKLQIRYYRPDGSMLGELEDEIEANPQRHSFWYSRGRGCKEPGKWQPGDYRVELLIDGVEKQSGTFTIFDDRPAISLDRTGTDLFSLPSPKAGFKGLGLDSSMDEFIPLPGSSHFDPVVPDRFVRPLPKIQSKSLGFDGWMNKITQDFSLGSEKPHLDPSGPLDDHGKVSACWAIDRRYMATMANARPGRVSRAALDEIEKIAEDYQALIANGPPKPPFALWTEESVKRKVGDAFDLAARAAVTLRDQASASRFYNAAREAYEAAGDKERAKACSADLCRMQAVESGNVDAEIRRLRSEIEKAPKISLSAARAGIDLGMLYSNNGDDTEALKLLGQARGILKKVAPDPSGVDLANALGGSILGILQGQHKGRPSAIEDTMEASNCYRLLYTAYARIYDTTDPAKAQEYRRKAEKRDSRQTNDDFSKAMLQALENGLLEKP